MFFPSEEVLIVHTYSFNFIFLHAMMCFSIFLKNLMERDSILSGENVKLGNKFLRIGCFSVIVSNLGA
jgi:hypothetical protein